jgi:hypothetical protein
MAVLSQEEKAASSFSGVTNRQVLNEVIILLHPQDLLHRPRMEIIPMPGLLLKMDLLAIAEKLVSV